eukprot:scaffold2059_cov33-Attheya_sp.AAC.6
MDYFRAGINYSVDEPPNIQWPICHPTSYLLSLMTSMRLTQVKERVQHSLFKVRAWDEMVDDEELMNYIY